MLELWGLQSNTSLSLLPGPLWPGVVVFERVLSMGQIELNYVLNWIAWNKTSFKLCTYAKVNCFKTELFRHLNCIMLLNWIAHNSTDPTLTMRTFGKLNCLKRNFFDLETAITLHWIVWNRNVLTFKCVQIKIDV